MIETSYATIESDGRKIEVKYFEDGEVREGPATFPARCASFAAIIQYIETQFNSRYLDISQRVHIQGLLGSPWPHTKLRFTWADSPQRQRENVSENKVFKTDVLGVGPWCVEFSDGEIVTCRTEERAKQMASTDGGPAKEEVNRSSPHHTTLIEDQIKYMLNRFLSWRLPENFNPDAGISFKPDYNEHTPWPMKHEPTGTNLFDATQAEEMIRYLVDGMPRDVTIKTAVTVPTPDFREMLLWLVNECAAMLAFEDEMRQSAGNTNVNIFKQRVDEARDVLSAEVGPRIEAGNIDFEKAERDAAATDRILDRRAAQPDLRALIAKLTEALTKACEGMVKRCGPADGECADGDEPWECLLCGSESASRESVKHTPDCPSAALESAIGAAPKEKP